jgi:arabinofuranosyltransferase
MDGQPAPLIPRGKTLPLLLAAVLVFALHTVYFWPWQEDDAFISFRYAQNLADGRGLVFNPGEKIEGFSNPAWVLLSAGVIKLGGDPLAAARVVGLLGGILALWLSWRLALILRPDAGATATLAPWILAVTPLLPRHATTGLETVPYTALLAWGVLAARSPAGPRFNLLLPAALLLLALLRPEGVLFALLIIGWRLWSPGLLDRLPGDWRPHRAAGASPLELVVFAVLFAGFLAWRWHYYGQFLPNTYFAKMTGETAGFIDGVHYSLDFLRENGGAVLAGLYLAVLLRRPPAALYWLMTLTVAALTLFTVLAGGDWMHFYRFYVPAMPLLASCAAAGLGTFLELKGSSKDVTIKLVVAAMLLVSLVNIYKTERASARLVMPDVQGGTYLTDGYHEAARWIRENTAPGTSLAVSDIGILGHESGRRIIDMFGLTDPHIARQEGRLHFKNDPRHVLEQQPHTVILVQGQDGQYLRVPDAALAANPDFQNQYQLVHTLEVGFRDEVIQIFARPSRSAP